MKHGAARHRAFRSGETGLPFLRTWSSVYLFVMASFFLVVVLLIVLTDFYS